MRRARAFRRKVIAIVAVVIIVVSVVMAYQFAGGNRSSSEPNSVVLHTNMGDITIELYSDMPITTSNLKNLVKRGVYNGTTFHRVVADFVVQGGGYYTNGTGVTAATIPDELPNKHSNIRGSVAMAKTNEPNSATSQFYINLKDNSGSLDSNYSVFGHVMDGMNVIDAIGSVATDSNEKPLQSVTIHSAKMV